MASATQDAITAPASKPNVHVPPISAPQITVAEKSKGQNLPSTAGPSVSSHKIPPDKAISFTIKWTCGILTLAASIVFGIWAPLSYKATAAGNRDNDAVQSSMISVMSTIGDSAWTANSIASSALSTASAQSSALIDMQSRLGLMGQLALIDFCITQTTLSACSSYLRSETTPLQSIVDQLGNPTSLAGSAAASTTISSANPTYASSTATQSGFGSAPNAGESAPNLSVEAILGIVFGVIGVGGAILGFCVWKLRQRRLMLQEAYGAG